MASTTLEAAREQALRLDSADRAALARELVASLDGPPDEDNVDQWEGEVIRRLDQIDSGDAEFLSAEEFRALTRDRLSNT